MRKLQTQDVFAAMRAITKTNLKEEIKPFLKKASAGDVNIEDVGIEGILGLIEVLSRNSSEQVFYEVLAGPFEIPPENVKTLDLVELAGKLETLSKENDLKRFFILLAGSITKKQ